MIRKIRKDKSNILLIVLLLIALFITVPFVYTAKYAIPSNDDYDYLIMLRHALQNNSNNLQVIWNLSMNRYMTWQGCWFSNLLVFTTFIPHVYHFNLPLYHAELIVGILLFYFSLLCISYEVVRFFRFKNTKASTILMFVLLVFLGTNLSRPDEVFYWLEGLEAYTIPFALGMFGISFYLRWVRKKKGIDIIFTSILGFLAGGDQY